MIHHLTAPRRGLIVFLAALLPALIGLSTASAATLRAKIFHVDLGYEEISTGAEFEAFLPDKLTVDAGDTIVFTLRSHEFHTVTFQAAKPVPARSSPSQTRTWPPTRWSSSRRPCRPAPCPTWRTRCICPLPSRGTHT